MTHPDARAPHPARATGTRPRTGDWLHQIEPFIGMVATERTPAHLDRADVQQEARIAVWRALETKNPDSPREYLIATVKRRTTSVVTRQDWTGQPSQQGGVGVDPLRRTGTDSLDRLIDEHGVEFVGAAADALARVEDGYHDGQVHQALAGLTEQERAYCVMRFWGGYTEAEIAAALGVNKKRVNNLWNRDTRPKLAAQLAGLRDRNRVTV